ncbi:MAG: 4-alpha-glucanotransferase [Gemmataceae bacterium]
MVAGVPPDYFSATGQLWGNPIYDWAEHARTGYAWWVDRLRQALRTVDLIRLDHFRGMERITRSRRRTDGGGRSVGAGPGAGLSPRCGRRPGGLPLIAEDLGFITPGVEARASSTCPACASCSSPSARRRGTLLPHGYDHNTVVYTGTHDNDTLAGWLAGLTANERAFLRRYVPPTGRRPGLGPDPHRLGVHRRSRRGAVSGSAGARHRGRG